MAATPRPRTDVALNTRPADLRAATPLPVKTVATPRPLPTVAPSPSLPRKPTPVPFSPNGVPLKPFVQSNPGHRPAVRGRRDLAGLFSRCAARGAECHAGRSGYAGQSTDRRPRVSQRRLRRHGARRQQGRFPPARHRPRQADPHRRRIPNGALLRRKAKSSRGMPRAVSRSPVSPAPTMAPSTSTPGKSPGPNRRATSTLPPRAAFATFRGL
jgi:hypothetical protein